METKTGKIYRRFENTKSLHGGFDSPPFKLMVDWSFQSTGINDTWGTITIWYSPDNVNPTYSVISIFSTAIKPIENRLVVAATTRSHGKRTNRSGTRWKERLLEPFFAENYAEIVEHLIQDSVRFDCHPMFGHDTVLEWLKRAKKGVK